MVGKIGTWSDRLLARFVPQATAQAAQTWYVCCGTSCKFRKLCWSCGALGDKVCCGPCLD